MSHRVAIIQALEPVIGPFMSRAIVTIHAHERSGTITSTIASAMRRGIRVSYDINSQHGSANSQTFGFVWGIGSWLSAVSWELTGGRGRRQADLSETPDVRWSMMRTSVRAISRAAASGGLPRA